MKDLISRFKSLPVSSKRLLGLGVVLAFVVALPLFIWAIVTQNFNPLKRAASGEPTPTPRPAAPISWSSGSMYVGANDFVVYANGKTYTGNSENVTITSGIIGENQTFMEVDSHQYGDDLRVKIVFSKGSNTWWISQVSGLNASYTPNPNWITNNGRFFESSFGYNYRLDGYGAISLNDPATGNQVALINYTNLQVGAFAGQTPAPTATAIPTTPPTNWCPGPNGASCSFSICATAQPCATGGVCYPLTCTVQPGICQNNVCVPGTPPPQTPRSFEIFFKFDGVSGDSASLPRVNDDPNSASRVNVIFLSRSLDNYVGYETGPLLVSYSDNGVYKLNFSVPYNQLPPANDYALILKGEKHLQVKFCTNGQTTHCDSIAAGHISIPAVLLGPISLNFIGIPLPAGDTSPSNFVVDASDFNAIKALLGKIGSTLNFNEKFAGDLNYDGRVDIRDIFLIRKTLETRYD